MSMMNRLKPQTHIDVESGTNLRVTSKPPVNDKLRNVVLIGNTVGGVNTASSFNLTSCGKNLFNPVVNLSSSTKVGDLYTLKPSATTYDHLVTRANFLNACNIQPNTTYTITFVCTRNTLNQTLMFNGASTIWSMQKILFTAGQTGTVTHTITTRSETDFTNANYGLWLSHIQTGVEGLEIDLKIMIELGSPATDDYLSYTGTTQTINIKDVDENLYQLDSYDKVENGKIIISEQGKNLFNPAVSISASTKNGDVYTLKPSAGTYDHLVTRADFLSLCNIKPNTTYTITFVCTRNTLNVSLTFSASSNIIFATTTTVIFAAGVTGTKTITATTNSEPIFSNASYGFWLSHEQTGVSGLECDLQIMIEKGTMASPTYKPFTYTPATYDLHPDEIAKLNNINTFQYETNIFTDAAVPPTIQGECRKIGNRPYVLTDLTDESGNYLADENGDYIGGLF